MGTGLHRPELRAWALYDWANSAFVCTVVTAIYPIYFSQVAASGMDPSLATARYAAATTVALAVAAVMAPLLGAVGDFYALRKRLLGVFLCLGVVSTISLGWVGPGQWQMGAVLFILANIGASGSFVFYDSLLPHVAAPDEVDQVSTAGYAAGYLGGGLMLALNLTWIMMPARFGFSSSEAAMRASFVSVGIWWALFSIPLFLRVSEPGAKPTGPTQNPIMVALSRLATTFSDLRRYRQAAILLAAFLIYNDGIGTIIRMTTVYGAEVGVERSAMIAAVLMVQFLGIPFTFLFGYLARWIGPKRSILLALAIYMLVSVVAHRMTTTREFFLLACLVAVSQGGCQALSRSLFSSLIPAHKSSEFFGFFSVAEKFAGVAGSAIFTGLVYATGSGRTAVLSLAGFFVIGGMLLSKLDLGEHPDV